MAEAASHCAVTLRQGENAHRLEISFTDNGLPYRISGECYAVFAAKKSDGTQLLNDCTIVNDTVIYDITAQTTAAPGKLSCEVRLYGETDKLIIAPKFSIFVEDSAIDESGVESSDEFSALNALISRSSSVAVFRLKGYFDSEEELTQLSAPTVGDAYGIGIRAPYEIYVWDAVNGEWVNHGTLQGEPGQDGAPGLPGTPGQPGEQGEQGVSGVYVGSGTAPEDYNVQIDPEGNADELVTEAPKDGKQYARKNGEWEEVEGGGGSSDELWRPTVDSAGNLSWEKSSASTAPTTQNIRGPQGETGTTGPQGPQGIPGPPGQDGQDGSGAEVTKENIAAALGYVPVDPFLLAAVDKKFRQLNAFLNGQTLDTENGTSPAYAQSVPTGAKAVSVNSIGGKSVAWNQIVSGIYSRLMNLAVIPSGQKLFLNHKYYGKANNTFTLMVRNTTNISVGSFYLGKGIITSGYEAISTGDPSDRTDGNFWAYMNEPNMFEYCYIVDLTQMFGAGNEPETTADPRIAMIEAYLTEHPEYNAGEIVSAEVTEIVSRKQDNTVLGTIQMPTALLSFLADKEYGCSAGSVYNEVDFEQKKYIRRVGSVDLGTLTYTYLSDNYFYHAIIPGKGKTALNLITPKFETEVGDWSAVPTKEIVWGNPSNDTVYFRTMIQYASAAAFKSARSGEMMYYELAEPVEYDISAYLEDGFNLLPAEGGGSLTFVQTDAELPVPNETEYAVELSEVLT